MSAQSPYPTGQHEEFRETVRALLGGLRLAVAPHEVMRNIVARSVSEESW